MATSIVRSRHGDTKKAAYSFSADGQMYFGGVATSGRAADWGTLIGGGGRPFAALLEELEADRGSAGERAPINYAGAGPEVAANRLEH